MTLFEELLTRVQDSDSISNEIKEALIEELNYERELSMARGGGYRADVGETDSIERLYDSNLNELFIWDQTQGGSTYYQHLYYVMRNKDTINLGLIPLRLQYPKGHGLPVGPAAYLSYIK